MGMALLKGKKPTPEEFNELADAASPDSLVARRFALEAERFVRGDRSGAAALKATLASWRNNRRGKLAKSSELILYKPTKTIPSSAMAYRLLVIREAL